MACMTMRFRRYSMSGVPRMLAMPPDAVVVVTSRRSTPEIVAAVRGLASDQGIRIP